MQIIKFHANIAHGMENFYESKKEGKDQESIQLSTIPDPGYQLESNKLIIRHQKQEPRGQPIFTK